METYAKLRYAHQSPQKVRLVADKVRGLSVESAFQWLAFCKKKAARLVEKVLSSAVANAEQNDGVDIDELEVSTIYVDEGPTLKRFRARAKGRSSRILKRSCHITVVVSEKID